MAFHGLASFRPVTTTWIEPLTFSSSAYAYRLDFSCILWSTSFRMVVEETEINREWCGEFRRRLEAVTMDTVETGDREA